MSERIEFTLVSDDDSPELLAEDSTSLLDELSQLDFEAIDRPPSGSAPPGTRVADPVTLATLAAVFSSPAVIAAAVDVAKSWLMRRQRGSIKIKVGKDEIAISAASSKEQEALVADFVARHRVTTDG
jgi:hypothetical protein